MRRTQCLAQIWGYCGTPCCVSRFISCFLRTGFSRLVEPQRSAKILISGFLSGNQFVTDICFVKTERELSHLKLWFKTKIVFP